MSASTAAGISYDDQLTRWAAGESIHSDSGCCPDFSCCCPELSAPIEVRRAFVAGNEENRMGLLGVFLHEAMVRANSERVDRGDDPVRIIALGPREDEPS